MNSLSQRLTAAFGAGTLGGIANALAAWLIGKAGITALLGVSIAPSLTSGMFYHRMVWGGIWGFILLMPVMRRSMLGRAIFLSLGPSLVQLLYVFPAKAGAGMFGLNLGTLTPLVVFILNLIWAITAVLWYDSISRR